MREDALSDDKVYHCGILSETVREARQPDEGDAESLDESPRVEQVRDEVHEQVRDVLEPVHDEVPELAHDETELERGEEKGLNLYLC